MAAGPPLTESRWTRYYAAVGHEPRETLLRALTLHAAEGRPPGFAVDLGAGGGRDTLELLRRGWRVLAIDSEPAAIELVRQRAAAAVGLQTRLSRFDAVELPPAELVTSSFSLPFAPPDAFARTWALIRSSLVPGGRFCGQLFGDRDGWAPADDMTFLARADVERLLADFEVERLDEVEEDGRTAVGEPKHWHLFHVVARQP